MTGGSNGRLAAITNGLLIVCALSVTGVFLSDRFWPSDKPTTLTLSKLKAVLKGSDWEREFGAGRVIGGPSNPVRILVFEDFECPACKYFEESVVRKLLTTYPQTLSVSVRHWPLDGHRMAMPLAAAAECADVQSAFWAFHMTAYENQDSLRVKSIPALAIEAGVPDTARFAACTAGESFKPRIMRDVELAKRLGGQGTPLIIVNGRMLPGVPDSSQLDALILEALDHARKQ